MTSAETGQTVLVLGAGFTRAFVPGSPLLTDFYDAEELLEKFEDFSHARNILKREMESNGSTRINLERLMTRLDGLMPYDYELNAEAELALLLRDLKAKFRQKLYKAKQSLRPHDDVLKALAESCVNDGIICVTFNYDDVFDEYLWNVRPVYTTVADPYWHPDGGYGFFCRPSSSCVADINTFKDRSSMTLLKLHGSVNWRVRRGSSAPISIDDIVHDEDWFKPQYPNPNYDHSDIVNHLESEPFIVPPVLTKSILTREPVLRLLWHLAHDELLGVKRVVFVGYSFPPTDMAARFLFTETILPDVSEIRVVNYATDEDAEKSVMDSYRSVFPNLETKHFDFRGAVVWADEFIERSGKGNGK
jgi:hypothetical protein